MKIMITGAEGQLGKTLQEILQHGRSEIGVVPGAYTGAQVLPFSRAELDVSVWEAVKESFRIHRPDLVFHLAAFTKVDESESRPDDAFRINALGTRNVAMAAQEVGAKMVYLSTDYVFSGDKKVPYSEWDLCAPQSVYSHTKHLGEHYVRDFCKRYFIVRTSWLYGYAGHNFVKTILRLARQQKEIRVVQDQKGNPTNAQDLAHHLLKIAETEVYGIYHCSGKGGCSWYEFARSIVSLSALPCRVLPCRTAELHQKARRPAYSLLEHRMLRQTVGDEMREWDVALKRFMEKYDHESGEIVR